MIPRLIRMCRTQWHCPFYLFKLEIPFLSKVGQKNENFQFKLNLSIRQSRIWRIQWWCSLFLLLTWNFAFLRNLFQKIKIVWRSWKFRVENNSNMQNSMVIFIFYFLDWKYPSWVNLFHKFKIVSLSWNILPRLFWICKIRWWCSLFLY